MTEQTAAPVRIERDGDVAVVVLDNPPLNLFTPAVFQALDAAVAQLIGPLFFRRTVTAEPLDDAFLAAVVSGFLDGHRAGPRGGGPAPA